MLFGCHCETVDIDMLFSSINRVTTHTCSLVLILHPTEMFSLLFWRYETFARSPNKLLGKQVVVRIENNEENARYAVLVIMFVMRVFFAR